MSPKFLFESYTQVAATDRLLSPPSAKSSQDALGQGGLRRYFYSRNYRLSTWKNEARHIARILNDVTGGISRTNPNDSTAVRRFPEGLAGTTVDNPAR